MEMEGMEEERRGEGKGREERRKTKSGYAYVSAHRQTDTQTLSAGKQFYYPTRPI